MLFLQISIYYIFVCTCRHITDVFYLEENENFLLFSVKRRTNRQRFCNLKKMLTTISISDFVLGTANTYIYVLKRTYIIIEPRFVFDYRNIVLRIITVSSVVYAVANFLLLLLFPHVLNS